MATRNFRELCELQWEQDNFVCVGLDSDEQKIPKSIKRRGYSRGGTVLAFNKAIVEKTADVAWGYKPNIAYYEALGPRGIEALIQTVEFINNYAPEKPVILDEKRADIGSTNLGYVTAAFEQYGVDAVTVHPYLGEEALRPFLDRQEREIIVLCRTSNPGAGEFQDLKVLPYNLPLYRVVARRVAVAWNKKGDAR